MTVSPRRLTPSKLLRRYFHPFNTRLLDGMRERAQTDELWEVMAWGAEECNLRFQLTRGSFLPTGPQLVVFNHHSPVDLFLASLIRRNDVSLLSAPGAMTIGGVVAKNCLPLFALDRGMSHPLEAFRVRVIYRLRDGVTPEAANLINLTSLTRAADVVSKGGTVAMTPTGGTIARSDNWRHGIGYILKRINVLQTKMVLGRIQGTRTSTAVRMLNPYWFRWFRKPKSVNVEIADPIPLSEFTKGNPSVEEISLRVKARYLEIFGSL